jgi:hypothetical protein
MLSYIYYWDCVVTKIQAMILTKLKIIVLKLIQSLPLSKSQDTIKSYNNTKITLRFIEFSS